MGIFLEKVKKGLNPRFLFLFLLPLAASFLLGSFFEKQQETLTIPIALVDEDQTGFSKAILEEMKNQDMLNVQEVSVREGKVLLERNEIDSLFILKNGFQELLLKEKGAETITLMTSPTSVASGIVQEVVASEVMKISSAIKAANRVQTLYERNGIESQFQWQEAYDYTMGQWEPEPLMTIRYVSGSQNEDQSVGQGDPTPPFISYLGIWGFFTMIVCFITCNWVVKERFILFLRMKTTYRGLSSYLRQSAAALLFFQIGQSLLSYWLFSHFGKIEGKALTMLGILIFILFGQSLSVWLSSYFSHIGSYYMAGTFVAFLFLLVGGNFIGIAEWAPFLETVSNWLPYKLLGNNEESEKWKVLFLTIGVSWILWRWSIWRLYER